MPGVRVLHLEDSAIDAELAAAALERGGLECSIEHVATRVGFERALEGGSFDVVLSDYDLPGFRGDEALALVRARDRDLPFLFVSGVLGEEVAIETLKQGATDYVLKQRIGRLAPAVLRALAEAGERRARRVAEDELECQRRRLAFVARSAEIGLWYGDLPLEELSGDERCKLHFGLAADERLTIGRFYEQLHPDDRGPTRRAIEAALEGSRFDVEYRTVAADGALRWIRAIGAVSRDAAGRVRSFDGLTLDVSEQKRGLEEREALLESERAARSEAERGSRIKDEFLATLSHELRTPLNAILGWTQILKSSPGPADLARGLDVIERNTRLQNQLIGDLLDMSRIVSGKVRLDLGPVDLGRVVASVVETVRPTAEARGVRLTCVGEGEPALVQADPARIEQVLWNLLTNAIKFTPRGGWVRVTLRRSSSQALVEVADSGEGIAPGFLPYVFDRFRQADSSTTRRHGGLGLGLAIVRQLVELHGGSVRVASDGTGRGSTFTASLPLTALRTFGLAGRDDAPGEEVGFAIAPKALEGVRVLVVDDDAESRDVVERMLANFGAQVETAGSAEEALGRIRSRRPDVLLSDIGMPGTDGYGLIRRVRALPRDAGGRIPAAALTAFARAEDRQRVLLAGFQTHIAKPAEPGELVAAVASLAGVAPG